MAETGSLSSGHCLSLLTSSHRLIQLSLPTADWSRASHLTLVEPIRSLPWKMKDGKEGREQEERQKRNEINHF